VRHRSCTRCAPLRRHRRSRARLRHCSCTAHTKQEQERERLRDGARGVSRPRVATCQLRIRRTLDRERQPLWRWNGVACSSTATEVNVCGSGCSVRSALQRTPSAPQKHAGMQRRFGSGRARSPGVQPRGPAACARLRQRCMGLRSSHAPRQAALFEDLHHANAEDLRLPPCCRLAQACRASRKQEAAENG
jgi:hypothetical protein